MKKLYLLFFLVACNNKEVQQTVFCPPIASTMNWGDYIQRCMMRVMKEAEEAPILYATRYTQCQKEDYKCMIEYCNDECTTYFCVKINIDTICKERANESKHP